MVCERRCTVHVIDMRLDIRKPGSPVKTVRVYQGDTLSTVLRVEVLDGGLPCDLSGLQARFECIKPDNTWVRELAATEPPNLVAYILPPEVAACEGLIDNAYLRFAGPGGDIDSAGPFCIEVIPSIDSAGAGESESYCPELDTLLGEMRNLVSSGELKDYGVLNNKPSIEGAVLTGRLNLADIGITAMSNAEIEAMFKGF